MPTFSPQFGDLNGDGHPDLLSGSNCCAPNVFHWFPIDDSGKILQQRSVEIKLDLGEHPALGKQECRPYVVDWNRDGKQDVVVVLCVYDRADKQEEDSSVVKRTYRLFVNTDREPGNDQGQQAAHQARSDGAALWNFKMYDFGPSNPLQAQRRNEHSYDRTTDIHFAFTDYDRDGNLDLLFCESVFRMERVNDATSGSYWRMIKISSAIYFMRNLTSTGEPRFEQPVKLYRVPEDWLANSIALVDFQRNGQQQVVAAVHRENPANPRKRDAELWLLQAPEVADDRQVDVDRIVAAIDAVQGRTEIDELGNLVRIDLTNCESVDDEFIRELGTIKSLKALLLLDTQVTDNCMKSLACFPNLEMLDMKTTRITNAGIEAMPPLDRLRWLGFSDTQVTDEGIGAILRHKNLKFIQVNGTTVTKEKIESLKKTNPQLKRIR